VPAAVPADTYAGQVLVPAEWRRTHPGPYTITISVLVDDEWVTRFGADAQKQAYAIVAAANQYFEPAAIKLRPALYAIWQSQDGASSLQQLLDQVDGSHHPSSADITVALTAQYSGPEGGIAHPDHRHIVVKHHPYRPDHDAFVLAHEIGHALGLSHHHCPHEYCLMSDHAYDPRQHWCPDHYRLLEENGGYFQYLSSLSA